MICSAPARVESSKAAFNASLLPDVLTRSAAEFPDNLYGLEIRQYDSDGEYVWDTGNDFGDKAIGEHLDVTLKAMDDCQLLLVARGNGGAIGTLGSKSLDEIRKMSVSSSVITAIDPLTGDMNKMPYVLHLEHVKVAVVGGKAMIQSPEGDFDTRLLLKRLATRLTVNWAVADEITSQDYALKEVKLCQVPANFSVIPTKEETSEWGVTYPSSVAEFIDYYRLTGTELSNANGTKTVWIPANVRGNSPKATSPYYRTKENAPTASSYVELVVDNSLKKERLYYRAYLGGEESTDFNLYGNKNYNWTLKVSSANYRDDGRIQLLDQTPVVSTNLVPTSNCLMMIPGTNICFNPYKHEAGTNGWNTYLTDGITLATDKTIASVKVLWQTKDAGTSGDLVMGYVIDDTHHENLVNVSDIGDKEKALVHVKVPVTQGGNAVIKAKNASGVTVWSWHIWVSEYVPIGLNQKSITSDATRTKAIETAQNATQGGMVHVYGGVSWTRSDGSFYRNVIMDRNLGATKAGTQTNRLDGVRTLGLLYQGGRKDPFFSTADGTKNEIKTIYDGYGKEVSLIKTKSGVLAGYQTVVQNPLTFFCRTGGSYLFTNMPNAWGPEGVKTIHDPCPAGWKVPDKQSFEKDGKEYKNMMAGWGKQDNQGMLPSPTQSGNMAAPNNILFWNGSELHELNENKNTSDMPGSGFLYIGGSGESKDGYTNKSAFYPGVSLREYNSGNYREFSGAKNSSFYLWSSSQYNSAGLLRFFQISGDGATASGGVSLWLDDRNEPREYGFSVRCIQDNGD